MIKYPSIEQFKHVIRQVKDRTYFDGLDAEGKAIYTIRELPTLTFTGTVKIHGTNAGVRMDKGNDALIPQSRERELSLTSDNAGFYVFTMQRKELFRKMLSGITEDFGNPDSVVVFGEYFGENIQKGVAVCNVKKSLAIFGVKVVYGDQEKWLPVDTAKEYFYLSELNEQDVYVITQFPSFELKINFNSPEDVQNKLHELTMQVEQECPVGKFFGHSGTGEGLVWSHSSEIGRFTFKTKGEKHSNSKVKSVAPIDEESFKKAKEFAENYTTEARLEQGLHVMKAEMQVEPDTQHIGTFIKWVVQDIMKEEQNAIIENNLDPKKVVKEVTAIARRWFLEKF